MKISDRQSGLILQSIACKVLHLVIISNKGSKITSAVPEMDIFGEIKCQIVSFSIFINQRLVVVNWFLTMFIEIRTSYPEEIIVENSFLVLVIIPVVSYYFFNRSDIGFEYVYRKSLVVLTKSIKTECKQTPPSLFVLNNIYEEIAPFPDLL
jgi:hypothetical protein